MLLKDVVPEYKGTLTLKNSKVKDVKFFKLIRLKISIY